MSSNSNAKATEPWTLGRRNEQIFRKCLEGVPFSVIALEHALTGARVEQIFKAEAKRMHPAVAEQIAGGRGFRDRFVEALRTQQAPA